MVKQSCGLQNLFDSKKYQMFSMSNVASIILAGSGIHTVVKIWLFLLNHVLPPRLVVAKLQFYLFISQRCSALLKPLLVYTLFIFYFTMAQRHKLQLYIRVFSSPLFNYQSHEKCHTNKLFSSFSTSRDEKRGFFRDGKAGIAPGQAATTKKTSPGPECAM